MPCKHCHESKERSQTDHDKLIHRLNRMEGQIRGIRGMVEKDAYCIDILMQVSAVSAALNAFSRELLGDHIRTCVREDVAAGREDTLEELISTLHKLMK